MYGQSNVCSGCVSPCQNCFGPASTQCLTCASSFVLKLGTNECVLPAGCVAGTVADVPAGLCRVCDSNCLTCENDTKSCLTCYREGGDFVFLSTNTSACLRNCY